MAKAEIERGGGQPTRFKMESKVSLPSKAKVYLQGITSKRNAATLDDLRDIVTNQVMLIKRATASEPMNEKQAEVLLKVVKCYQIMDTATDKEHAKYDLTSLTEEELKALAGGPPSERAEQ